MLQADFQSATADARDSTVYPVATHGDSDLSVLNFVQRPERRSTYHSFDPAASQSQSQPRSAGSDETLFVPAGYHGPARFGSTWNREGRRLISPLLSGSS